MLSGRRLATPPPTACRTRTRAAVLPQEGHHAPATPIVVSHIKEMPGWSEELATVSEAVVKAEEVRLPRPRPRGLFWHLPAALGTEASAHCLPAHCLSAVPACLLTLTDCCCSATSTPSRSCSNSQWRSFCRCDPRPFLSPPPTSHTTTHTCPSSLPPPPQHGAYRLSRCPLARPHSHPALVLHACLQEEEARASRPKSASPADAEAPLAGKPESSAGGI